MKILIVGGTGMLGLTVLRYLSQEKGWEVSGTIRSAADGAGISSEFGVRTVGVANLEDLGAITDLLYSFRPEIVINCAGLRREAGAAIDPLRAISIYATLPFRLSHLCRRINARLVQISSDGVFSGSKGQYSEDDVPDATDIYGVSKSLGEITAPHAITIRTSIIGHEWKTSAGLLEWFLAQQGECKGFSRVLFSGLPAVELAAIIRNVVIPRPELSGIYHVAAQPISKLELLRLIADVYGKKITILPDPQPVIDRTLSAAKFERATGYHPPSWRQLIDTMRSYR